MNQIRSADAKTLYLLSILAHEPNVHDRSSLANIYGMTPKGVSDIIARARAFGVSIKYTRISRLGGAYSVTDWGPFNSAWVKENKDALLRQALNN